MVSPEWAAATRQDLKPGQLITHAEISKVVESRGVFIRLSAHLPAEAPRERLANVPLKAVPEGRRAPRGKLKVRVLHVEPCTTRITCTAKKELVKAGPCCGAPGVRRSGARLRQAAGPGPDDGQAQSRKVNAMKIVCVTPFSPNPPRSSSEAAPFFAKASPKCK